MKSLIVFYSKTGNTKKVAESISKTFASDMEELSEKNKRSGFAGYFLAGRDAALKKNSDLNEVNKRPGTYDLVVIGTPVWAFTVTPAVRTFLNIHKGELKKVAFFCCQGGSGSERAFAEMERICGKGPVAKAVFDEKDIKSGRYLDKAKEFAEKLSEA